MKYSRPGTIEDFFKAVQTTLKEIWQQDGFGVFSISSQRSVSYTRQQVILCDSTHYSFAFTDQEIESWRTLRHQDTCNSFSASDTGNQPEQLLRCLEQRLLRTWAETGCGCLEVKSERSGRNTTRVMIGGAPSYCFHLNNQDIQRWMQQGQAIAHPVHSLL